MLRIFKIYNFNLQNPNVIAKTMSFSSRPGHIIFFFKICE